MDINELEELSGTVEASADLAQADLLRVAADTVERDDTSPARFAAVRGNAYFVASRLSGRDSDLDQAILWQSTAARTEPTPTRAANLAVALLDRGERDGSATDYQHAITLLRLASDDPAVAEPYRRMWTVALFHAYVAAVQYDVGIADVEELIDHGEAVVARYPGTDDGGVEGLLGAAYLLAAQRGHERADLDRMIELLDISLAHLPAGHPDLPGRSATLGGALLERYELRGDPADLARGLPLLAGSNDDLAVSDSIRPLVLNNTLNAVLAEYERTGDAAGLEKFLPRVAELADAYSPTHPMYPIAMSNAGLLVRQAAHALDRLELIDDAIAYQEAAVSATAAESPALPDRLVKLAVAFGDRYARDGQPADLDRAIELGTQGLDSITGSGPDMAGFAVNLGSYLHDRYLLRGRMSDLRSAADLHARGMRSLSAAHHDRAKALSSAGIVRLDLYQRLADPADLDQAAGYLSEAVAAGETGDQDIDIAAYLVNLAFVRYRQAAVRHTDRRLAEAQSLAEQARELARGRTVRSAADGVLAYVQRDRYARTSNPEDLARFVEIDSRSEPADATEHLRRSIRLGLSRDRDGELRQLLITLDVGVESRPEVAITAARLLADLGVRWLAGGEEDGLGLVERAAAGAMTARDRLVGTGEGRAADLSWHRDLSGLGALWAHARWLSGDLGGALTAFDTTRAVLLSPYFPPPAPVEQTYLALWCTSVGGAGVVARPNGALTPVALPALTTDSAARLASRLSAAALIGPQSLDPVLALAGDRITRIITAPLESVLAEGEPVVCAAGGPLGLLPIGLGTVGDRPLAARNLLTFGLHRRSAAWARQAAGPLDTADVVSVACPLSETLPALPAAARESTSFAPPARRRHGAAATPEVLLDALRGASLVHVATHASIQTNDPLAQYLLLAGDTPLFADAVLDAAPLTARLAVLSGCGTGRTTIAHADESLALASAIHAAGVPGVLSSLWSVLDPPTARFMGRVVANMHDGQPPAQALRSAQVKAIAAGSRTADWAAFTFLGA